MSASEPINDSRSAYLGNLLDEAREEVGYADHKASIILAALGIGFSAVLGGMLASDWSPSDLGGWSQLFWWLSAVLAGLSVLASSLAVWPRLGNPSPGRGIFYWGQVARFASKQEFSKAIEMLQPSFEERTKDQLWELARIVTKKYRWIRRSMVLFSISISGFALAGLVEAALG